MHVQALAAGEGGPLLLLLLLLLLLRVPVGGRRRGGRRGGGGVVVVGGLADAELVGTRKKISTVKRWSFPNIWNSTKKKDPSVHRLFFGRDVLRHRWTATLFSSKVGVWT